MSLALAAGGALVVTAGGLLVSAASDSPAPAKTFETDAEGMSQWYDVALSRVTSPAAHSGSFSLRVRPRSDSWGVEEAWPGEFSVSAGTTYRFGAWTRAATGTTSVDMSVAWVGADRRQIKQDTIATAPSLTKTWTEKSKTLTAPTGATSVVFRFTGTGRGSWLMDDVTVQPTPATTTTPPATTSSGTPTTTPTTTTTSAPPPPSTTTTTPAPAATSTTTTAAPPAATTTCTNPAFVTSRSDDGWSDGGYYVHNNEWNASGYNVTQSLAACSYRNWSVTATADNNNGDGAVKTYPNVHKDYHDWGTGKEPLLSSFSTITSRFAATSPHVGIYNVAYDIWLNGVPGNREIMIWTDNYRQVPAGSKVASGLSFSGTTWDLYATSGNGYLAFVPAQPMTSGTLDLKAFLDYLVSNGRVPSNSTLGQICFGVEVVSTDGKPATFQFTDFSISN
ncbi:GH12 family glycosyl hydrolase domain-containing protein [Actinophytocola sp.]|uniref:GH12 family glycosyl hydrolase domain-containing protein n=1 Tax=Actinophytocola sp. TaxID=1872138 RepID=UPI002ED69EB0